MVMTIYLTKALFDMDLKAKHDAELENLRQRYSNQIKAIKKQLEVEEARLRSRQSNELSRAQRKETVKTQ